MTETSTAFNLETFFLALGDRTRLRLLNLMGETEVCVCFLVEALETNQPKISRHLACLRQAGIVAARRDGKWIHYRIVDPPDPQAAQVFHQIREWISLQEDMQQDRARLLGICCATQLPVRIQTAPRPTLSGNHPAPAS
ncbi:MAG: metalloregulator ArsR/SmtB family transcription factor [Blastocatellia bacterium]|nr:metalloregulator ArsR/SmtB family transcription factor [Blastocatellia bacterium]